MAGIRLDKLLSKSGFGSRTDVKKMIAARRVTVCGKVVTDSGQKAEAADVLADGKPILYQEYIYLLMNKPKGVLSSTEKRGVPTVVDLIADKYKKYEPFPVGRLDIDTEGLLLITNDGPLAHELLSPKKHVDKTYYAEIDGTVTSEDVQLFSRGIDIGEKELTRPAKLEIIESGETSKVYITICEGKFHQIKRMFHAAGKSVTYLKRIRMGSLTLPDGLKCGSYVEIPCPFVQSAQKNG